MMKRLFLSCFLIFGLLISLSYGQTDTQTLNQQPVISVAGRLVLETRGKEEKLALHGKDAKSYLIKGDLVGKLKDLLLELGKDNLVSVAGKQDAYYDISCHNSYQFDSKGSKKVDTTCIRYYHFEVTQLIESKKSAEEMPPPERDIEEEKSVRVRAMSKLQPQDLGLTIITRENATIASLNLKSPIKTVEINYRDKDNKLRKETLLITSGSLFAKKNKLDETKPTYVTANALKTGQEVIVVYSLDQFMIGRAVFITITKE